MNFPLEMNQVILSYLILSYSSLILMDVDCCKPNIMIPALSPVRLGCFCLLPCSYSEQFELRLTKRSHNAKQLSVPPAFLYDRGVTLAQITFYCHVVVKRYKHQDMSLAAPV